MTRPWYLTHAVGLLRTLIDLSVLAGAYYLSFLLRFEGAVPAPYFEAFQYSLSSVLLAQYLCMVACKVPEASWRFVSLHEVRRIGMALIFATAILLVLICSADFIYALRPELNSIIPPRGVIAIDLLLCMVSLVGMRAAVRVWCEHSRRARDGTGKLPAKITKTLLIGAGSAGAEAVKQIAAAPQLGIDLVGFLDDDPKKHGLVIHGTRVLGSIADAAKIAQIHGASQALITIGNPSGANLRRIVDACRKSGLCTKVIPGIAHILDGKVNLSAIRDLAIEDLLQREPVQLDLEAIAGYINGRRILVTGAGGSIGSELCRIVCRFGPACLVLVENTENNLFHIHRELTSEDKEKDTAKTQAVPRDLPASLPKCLPVSVVRGVEIVPCLADICDHVRMEQIFSTYHPDMVLHAAAYKHVPMIEWNPGEAIKNNVVGTRTIADLADQYGVSEFVMISTDKAVNPTSVMGASKRVAEIYIQALSQRSQTRFVAVRFGNVLGSAGSVIPTFKEQIARGGPVTVTHPEMKRFFMTIPEASQLVLQAATLGRGGEIFILDMGEPVKIVDLARNLIGLAGFTLDEIEIRFTGLRPGEKLYEELALKEETVKKTRHPKIFIGRLQPVEWEEISQAVASLQELADAPESSAILYKLKEIVPEFEGVETALPSGARVRSDPGHAAAGLNGNGMALRMKPMAATGLSGVNSLLPPAENKG